MPCFTFIVHCMRLSCSIKRYFTLLTLSWNEDSQTPCRSAPLDPAGGLPSRDTWSLCPRSQKLPRPVALSTFAPVERLFSVAGLTKTPGCNRLSDRMFAEAKWHWLTVTADGYVLLVSLITWQMIIYTILASGWSCADWCMDYDSNISVHNDFDFNDLKSF